jgi:tetratricopeptide (TPR) repeat protein
MTDPSSKGKNPDRPLRFKATLPTFPDAVPITAKEYEEVTKAKFEASDGKDLTTLYNLSTFYSQCGRLEEAEACILQLLAAKKNSSDTAVHLLQLGQIAERRDDYELAIDHYQRGLEAGPTMQFAQYFLRNNLGYSLIRMRRYKEAKPLLEEAIKINPNRANAYKNLGFSFWGLGKRVEAAKYFIEATCVDAGDRRSLRHLEKLYSIHPKIAESIPEFDSLLMACRAAVKEADRHRPDLRAWWKKRREELSLPPS